MDLSDYVRDRLHYEVLRSAGGPVRKFDEFEVLRRFGVPRSAVRRALRSLSVAGLVKRERRYGTTPEPPITTFTFADRAGFEGVGEDLPQMMTTAMERLPAPDDITTDLDLPPGTEVTFLERSTRAAGQRLSHWRIWTPLDVPATFPDGPPDGWTWYQIAGEILGEREFAVERTSMAAVSTAEDSELLDVPVGSTLQFTVRLTRTGSGRVVDRSFCRMSCTRMVANETIVVRL